MVLTATQQDKTLQNSVNMFYVIHQEEKEKLQFELAKKIDEERKADLLNPVKKAGRPKKYEVKVPKSKTQDISLNTAAFSKARERVPMHIINDLFAKSKISDAQNDYSHWYGYKVYIADGTYLQMQDTKDICKEYPKCNGAANVIGYPQALLEVLIERGTGQVTDFRIGSRSVSELSLFNELLDVVEPKSLLLADDLYNCFEVFAKCSRLGIGLVVADKKDRNYTMIEKLSNGDRIVEIKASGNRSKWSYEKEKAKTLKLRQITCQSADGKEYNLLTTIIDQTITKEDIQILYASRWDIEISIREVKTIMDINVLRSKTPEMAKKELVVTLATYNLIRKIIYKSILNMPFSPKEDFIYKMYKANQNILIDKKGRVYNRWSTGRRGNKTTDMQTS
jgi:hypothetical protein